MRISIEGIDKSGKTTLAKTLHKNLTSGGMDVGLAPRFLDFYSGTTTDYDKLFDKLPMEEIVKLEIGFRDARDIYMKSENRSNWILDRGDLTLFANSIAHLMEPPKRRSLNEAYEEFSIILGGDRNRLSDDVYLFLDLAPKEKFLVKEPRDQLESQTRGV